MVRICVGKQQAVFHFNAMIWGWRVTLPIWGSQTGSQKAFQFILPKSGYYLGGFCASVWLVSIFHSRKVLSVSRITVAITVNYSFSLRTRPQDPWEACELGGFQPLHGNLIYFLYHFIPAGPQSVRQLCTLLSRREPLCLSWGWWRGEWSTEAIGQTLFCLHVRWLQCFENSVKKKLCIYFFCVYFVSVSAFLLFYSKHHTSQGKKNYPINRVNPKVPLSTTPTPQRTHTLTHSHTHSLTWSDLPDWWWSM